MIELVDIQITSKCNRNCSYCYSNKSINDEISMEDFIKIIDILLENNISKICISGGEPFLHPSIKDMLEYCKNKGFSISISTNGDCQDKIIECLKFIDVLGLPLESGIKNIHDSIRGESSFNNSDTSTMIRIGTLVLPKNIESIKSISNIINRYNKICNWKIYEQIKYNQNHEISHNLFMDNLSQIKSLQYKLLKANLIISNRKNRNKGYFIIEADGNVFIPILDESIDKKYYLGNIYSDKSKIINSWNYISIDDNHNQMIISIYNKGETRNE